MKLQSNAMQQDANVAKLQQSLAMVQDEDPDNLVKWQLDISGTLARIERLLRGDEPVEDGKGNIVWQSPQDESKQIMNNAGIREIMRIITMYVSKDLMLSRFDDKEIKVRMKNFALTIGNLVHNKYNAFGWSKEEQMWDHENGVYFTVTIGDKEKIKHYESLLLSIIDLVEASYKRALEGGERDSIGTRTSVIQTDSLNDRMPMAQTPRRGGFLNPAGWT